MNSEGGSLTLFTGLLAAQRLYGRFYSTGEGVGWLAPERRRAGHGLAVGERGVWRDVTARGFAGAAGYRIWPSTTPKPAPLRENQLNSYLAN